MPTLFARATGRPQCWRGEPPIRIRAAGTSVIASRAPAVPPALGGPRRTARAMRSSASGTRGTTADHRCTEEARRMIVNVPAGQTGVAQHSRSS